MPAGDRLTDAIVVVGIVLVGVAIGVISSHPYAFKPLSHDDQDDVSRWGSIHPYDRCPRHHTKLTDDAIRGPFCEDCDRVDDIAVADLCHRFSAWIWKRLTFTD